MRPDYSDIFVLFFNELTSLAEQIRGREGAEEEEEEVIE